MRRELPEIYARNMLEIDCGAKWMMAWGWGGEMKESQNGILLSNDQCMLRILEHNHTRKRGHTPGSL